MTDTYSPETCCACRWVVWNEDCGHSESDGITSPHDHCALHDGSPTTSGSASDSAAATTGSVVNVGDGAPGS